MKHIKESYKLFYQSIDKKPISSAFILGNLFLNTTAGQLKAQSKDNVNKMAQNQLDKIIKCISADQVSCIVEVFRNMKPARWRVLNVANKKCLNALKLNLPVYQDVYQKMPYDDMHFLVHNIDSFRLIQVCMIRKHLHENKYRDPFQGNFSYDLLVHVDGQRNGLYVSAFVKNCKSLPVAQLVQLGKISIHYARCAIHDIGCHVDSFPIQCQMLTEYPDLKDEIYQLWKQRIQTQVWTDIERQSIDKQVEIAAKQFPEFENLLPKKRIERTSTVILASAPTVSTKRNEEMAITQDKVSPGYNQTLAQLFAGGIAAMANMVAQKTNFYHGILFRNIPYIGVLRSLASIVGSNPTAQTLAVLAASVGLERTMFHGYQFLKSKLSNNQEKKMILDGKVSAPLSTVKIPRL